MTVAVLPLALISAKIGNLRLYWINLVFLALLPALYAAFVYFGRESGFRRWQVVCFVAAYALYIPIAVVFGLGKMS